MQVNAIYLDFAKVFDKVDHAILIAKLRNLGYGGNLLELIESYLQDRIKVVIIKGYRSSAVNASSGVPQGSILRLILFAFLSMTYFLLSEIAKQ